MKWKNNGTLTNAPHLFEIKIGIKKFLMFNAMGKGEEYSRIYVV